MRSESLAAVFAAFLVSACAEDNPRLLEPLVPQGPGPVAKVIHEQDSALTVAGIPVRLSVAVLDARDATLSDRFVTWSSSNEAVAIVAQVGNCGPTAQRGCYRTSVYGVSSGVAMITATVDGISASIPVRVVTQLPAAQGVKIDFSLLELSANEYAPLITVIETTRARAIEVIALRIGFAGSSWFIDCRGSVFVAAGASEAMFNEIYGDYQLTVDPYAIRTSNEAHAAVYMRDATTGAVEWVEAIGPISKGSYPTTYTGGNPKNQWNCE